MNEEGPRWHQVQGREAHAAKVAWCRYIRCKLTWSKYTRRFTR